MPEADDIEPRSLDEFMLRLQRRLAQDDPQWRVCPAPRCRRARACTDARMPCLGEPQPASEAECEEAVASLRSAVRAAMAKHGRA